MKTKKIIPILLISSLLLSSCGKKPEIETEDVHTAVKVTELTPSSIEKSVIYNGKIEPLEQVTVVSKLTGTVTNTYKNIGDSVSQGEVLFDIDKKDIQNSINQAKAGANTASVAVTQAQNSLNNITGSQYEQSLLQLETTIQNLKNSLTQAQDALNLATTTYENAKVLYSGGAMSKSDYDNAEYSYTQAKIAVDSTKNQLKQAEDSYNLTKNKAVNENKNSAQIGIEQAKANKASADLSLNIASQNLQDASPKSPISGVVSYKGATVGQMISPSTQAYTISNIDEVTATVKVSEAIINTLTIGEKVNVRISALNKEFVGEITEINPVADQTSTYPIKIKLDNKNHEIKPGMFSEVRFVTEKNDNTIVVNREVVLRNMETLYVYILEGDTAVSKEVTTGIDNGEQIEILSGVSIGDKVISEGQSYVSDGDIINVVN